MWLAGQLLNLDKVQKPCRNLKVGALYRGSRAWHRGEVWDFLIMAMKYRRH
nr:MAG TPA: hypothetical protein [Caudoviricetes sp.]